MGKSKKFKTSKQKGSVFNIDDSEPPFCAGQCIAVKYLVAKYEVLMDSYSSEPASYCDADEQNIRDRASRAVLRWIRNNSSYRLISECDIDGCECADDSFVETKVWSGEKFWRYEWSTDYLINGELGVCYHHVTIRVNLEKWRAIGECVPRSGLLLPHGSEFY